MHSIAEMNTNILHNIYSIHKNLWQQKNLPYLYSQGHQKTLTNWHIIYLCQILSYEVANMYQSITRVYTHYLLGLHKVSSHPDSLNISSFEAKPCQGEKKAQLASKSRQEVATANIREQTYRNKTHKAKSI